MSISTKHILAMGAENGEVRFWDLDARALVRVVEADAAYLAGHETGGWDAAGDKLVLRTLGGTRSAGLDGRFTQTREPMVLPAGVNVHHLRELVTTTSGGAGAVIERQLGERELVVWARGQLQQPPRTVKMHGFPSSIVGAARHIVVPVQRVVGEDAAGNDKVITELHLVDTDTGDAGAALATMAERFEITATTPDASLVALSAEGRLVFRDTRLKRDRWTTLAPYREGASSSWFSSGAFTSDAKQLAVIVDGAIALYDLDARRLVATFGHQVRVLRDIAFTSDNALVVGSANDRWMSGSSFLSFWSLSQGRMTRVATLPERRAFTGTTTGGALALMGRHYDRRCSRGQTAIDLTKMAAVAPPMNASEPTQTTCLDGEFAVAVDPRHERAVIRQRAPADSVLYDVATKTGTPLARSSGHGAFFFSRDGRWLASERGTIWNAKTGAALTTDLLERVDKGAELRAIEFSHDGRRVALATSRIHLVDLPSLRVLWSADAPRAGFIAVTPDDSVVASQADGTVAVLRDGRIVASTRVGTNVTGLDLDATGRAVATIHFDGGARLWDARDARLRATLYDFPDGEHMILTPGGAYSGTAEVADRLGWVFDEPREVFRFEQYARVYDRPSVVRDALTGGSVAALPAITRAPRIELFGPPRIAGGIASVKLGVTSPSRVDVVRAYVEGRLVMQRAVCAARGDVSLDLPLLPGKNRVTLVAFDDQGFSSAHTAFNADGPPAGDRRPALWILAMGVSQYPALTREQQLDAADDDARAIAATLGGQAGAEKPFREVHATVLIDDAVTADTASKALDAMAAMSPDDVGVVFFAGHGVKVPGSEETMLMTSASAATAESLRATALAWPMLSSRLGKMRGRIALLLDACHAGHVSTAIVAPNEALAAALAHDDRAGVAIFAAAKGAQYSYEGNTARGLHLEPGRAAAVQASGPHGFFTAAILRALESSSTDHDGDGAIQWSELVDEVKGRVTAATGGKQTPWEARREVMGDFQIARSPLAQQR